MPRAHPVPRQRRHRDRLVRSHQLARTRRSRERESLGCQRCGTRTPLGWKKGARGLFRLIPRRRKFVSSTDCLTAAVHGRLQLADAGSSVRRVRHHFADVQDRALNGRFEANSSESRPSEAGHQRSSTNGSLLASRFTANSTAQSNPGCAVWCCSMRPASSRTPKPAVGLNCPASSRTARRWSNGAATSHARRSGNTRL